MHPTPSCRTGHTALHHQVSVLLTLAGTVRQAHGVFWHLQDTLRQPVLSRDCSLTAEVCGDGRSVYLPLSIKHNIDLGSIEALRRGVMHLFNIDFALEWPRALPPNVKLVGPLMPEPAKALPADLQVHAPCHI